MRWLFFLSNRILCESSSAGRVIDTQTKKAGSIVTNKISDIYQFRTNDMSCFKERNYGITKIFFLINKVGGKIIDYKINNNFYAN